MGHQLLLHPGLDAVHHGTDHLHHGADLSYGGLHVGAGDPGHLDVGGAHQGEGHRLLHNLHVLHRGDDTSGDGSHLEVFK